MAKINGIFNNIITKIKNGKYVLEIKNDFLSGEKIGYGKSYFEFHKSGFFYDIITEKTFILSLKNLEKEVIKYEIENK
jgi:hypothetical protein